MHSKQKGNIGAAAVILELVQSGINVFTELGDYSKVDIIAEKGGILKKIQVKYGGQKKDAVLLNLVKSGPNGYRYHYENTDVDWFAVYHPYSNKVYWISATEACENRTAVTLRVVPPKNNNKVNINSAADYNIERVLRDFTRDTHPARAAGDDKVQPTTP